MCRHRNTVVAMSLGLFAAIGANAETAIAGAGTVDCGKFVKLRRETPKAAEIFTDWTQGFLSGANTEKLMRKLKSIDIPENEMLGLMLESQCVKDPTLNVWLASVQIQKELEKNTR